MSLIKSLFIIPAIALGLSACTLKNESYINTQKLQARVEAKEFVLENDQDIQEVADLYKRGGQDSVRIVSTYTDGNASLAQKNALNAASRLKALGVRNVSADAVSGSDNVIIANFELLDVAAHDSCVSIKDRITQSKGYGVGDYRFGCEIDGNFGKQVANTADLEGRVPDEGFYKDNDGRQTANVIDEYRKGEPNKRMVGLNSSEVAESK